MVDVKSFIMDNITPYNGTSDFLCKATERTNNLWRKCLFAIIKEKNSGKVKIDTLTPSYIILPPIIL